MKAAKFLGLGAIVVLAGAVFFLHNTPTPRVGNTPHSQVLGISVGPLPQSSSNFTISFTPTPAPAAPSPTPKDTPQPTDTPAPPVTGPPAAPPPAPAPVAYWIAACGSLNPNQTQQSETFSITASGTYKISYQAIDATQSTSDANCQQPFSNLSACYGQSDTFNFSINGPNNEAASGSVVAPTNCSAPVSGTSQTLPMDPGTWTITASCQHCTYLVRVDPL